MLFFACYDVCFTHQDPLLFEKANERLVLAASAKLDKQQQVISNAHNNTNVLSQRRSMVIRAESFYRDTIMYMFKHDHPNHVYETLCCYFLWSLCHHYPDEDEDSELFHLCDRLEQWLFDYLCTYLRCCPHSRLPKLSIHPPKHALPSAQPCECTSLHLTDNDLHVICLCHTWTHPLPFPYQYHSRFPRMRRRQLRRDSWATLTGKDKPPNEPWKSICIEFCIESNMQRASMNKLDAWLASTDKQSNDPQECVGPLFHLMYSCLISCDAYDTYRSKVHSCLHSFAAGHWRRGKEGRRRRVELAYTLTHLYLFDVRYKLTNCLGIHADIQSTVDLIVKHITHNIKSPIIDMMAPDLTAEMAAILKAIQLWHPNLHPSIPPAIHALVSALPMQIERFYTSFGSKAREITIDYHMRMHLFHTLLMLYEVELAQEEREREEKKMPLQPVHVRT